MLTRELGVPQTSLLCLTSHTAAVPSHTALGAAGNGAFQPEDPGQRFLQCFPSTLRSCTQ